MDDDILREFLTESWENLARLDAEVVALEKEPQSAALLGSIFRTIHTIKGTCGFIGLTRLGGLAHATENVLGRMRDGELPATSDVITLVLEAVDRIKELLAGLEATGREPSGDHAALIARLDHAAEQSPPCSPPAGIEVEPTDAGPTEAEPLRKAVAELSIRVGVDVLDNLMNLVGELVQTRNQLLQLTRADDESQYAAPIAHLNRVTTDLQDEVMKTRMQPIGNAWSKLPRLVRDLSRVMGRPIELEMHGADTELDRTVLDAIRDPLTHMVRNSADHGIEPPEQRRAAGKSEVGHIRLRAGHEGGHVVISIEDDGAGIDAEKVLRKAIEQGLVTEVEAGRLTPAAISALIFHPGFSTADRVSEVSGRGVGMDVVKTEIEKIGGTVDLHSVPGQGTTVRIKIPLTLAIIPVLVVESGGECFAVPQRGVVELVRLTAADRQRIERIHDRRLFRLRNRLLPLVDLDEVLGLNDRRANEPGDRCGWGKVFVPQRSRALKGLAQSESADCESVSAGARSCVALPQPHSEHTDDQSIESGPDDLDADTNIVVVQSGEEQFGLIVSAVFDTEEIVVKPLGRLLQDLPVYQGTTILGDGRVITILDIAGIAEHCGGLSAGTTPKSQAGPTEWEHGDGTDLLLFAAGDAAPKAVPLWLVSRLEEFPADRIERVGETCVAQYRGELLPLLPIFGASGASGATCDPQPVIVFSENECAMGLMVDRILDVIREPLIIRMNSRRPGVLGTAILNGRATDVIDTQHYVVQSNPAWFERRPERPEWSLLVLDDSQFFRQLVSTSLQSKGHQVVSVESAAKALELLERGRRFDAVVSDIEMPEMDGFEFARRVRQRPELADLPLIALSSLNIAGTQAQAQAAGFDRYLLKFDAPTLHAALDELCLHSPTRRTGASA